MSELPERLAVHSPSKEAVNVVGIPERASRSLGLWLSMLAALGALLPAVGAATVMEADGSNSRIVRVRSDSPTEAGAQSDALRWLVGELVPPRGLKLRQPAIDADVFGHLSTYVQNVSRRDGKYEVSLDVTRVVRALVLAILGTEMPTVEVGITADDAERNPAATDAVQTEVARFFLEYGFQMVDTGAVRPASGSGQTPAAPSQAGGSGVPSGARPGADLHLQGRAIVVANDQADGGEARVELKAVEVNTGRTIGAATGSHWMQGVGFSDIDRLEAIQRAAQEASFGLVRQCIAAYCSPLFSVRVDDVANLSEARQIRDEVARTVPEATVTLVSTRLVGERRSALIQVACRRTTAQIASAVTGMAECKLKAVSIGFRSLVVSPVRPDDDAPATTK